MKRGIILLFLLSGIIFNVSSQSDVNWNAWKWLVGEWIGKGTGQPGEGTGGFSFRLDLASKILIRNAHTEFPASNNRPAFVHDDLMIIYLDSENAPTKAIYFDNEGHTINYTIQYTGNSIVLLSEKLPGMPVFRLSYKPVENNTVHISFEMSQDGEKFMTYIEGDNVRAH